MCRFVLGLLVCTGYALAQGEAAPAAKGYVRLGPLGGPVGVTTALAGPMPNVTGAPYSAETVTQRNQLLADGNRIVQSQSGTVARDSRGRTRREEMLPGVKRGDGEAARLVMIDDPVAHVHWTLDPETKTAMKLPIPDIQAGPAGVVAGSGASTNRAFFFTSTTAPGSSVAILQGSDPSKAGGGENDENGGTTDLGTQTIEGVQAKGTRVAHTFPAGSELGNEQPLTITTETWYSPDLKVLVLSKSNDPRMGETIYKLTNIQRAEPAASLFQVPEEYSIKDAPGLTLHLQQSK